MELNKIPISEATNECNLKMMRRYPDNFFDLGIIDPQTGQGEDKKHLSRNGKSVIQKNGSSLIDKTKHRISNWDEKPPSILFWKEFFRVTKHQIIMCENNLSFTQKKTSAGRIIWNLLRDNDFSDCQIMWTDLTNKIDYFEFMWNGMLQGYQINNRQQQGNKQLNEKRIHPNQKPVIVYGELLKRYAKPGYKILDTHLGSGSLRVACDELGFDFYGCEKDELIFNDQEKRFSNFKKQPKLFLPEHFEQSSIQLTIE